MSAQGFFRIEERGGRHWLMDPLGHAFWTTGLNHIDSATLRYPDSGGVWESEFNNSMKRFCGQVHRDLTDWGFNTVGWVQEVLIIKEHFHRHSGSFSFEEYQWLDMPYCHMLPWAEIHHWEVEARLPDMRSSEFEEMCDAVAREHCARFKDDPKLIGYFYSDCPAWVHTIPENAWRGSLFDPERLKTDAGRQELFDLATRYYRVTLEAVRRYDPNHIILGDRYEANRPLPEEVVRAALPYVDVLSFQCFGQPDHVQGRLRHWAELTGKPVLLADCCGSDDPHGIEYPPTKDRLQSARHYNEMMDRLWEIPQAIGYHLCGGYLRNRVRHCGFRTLTNEPIQATIDSMSQVNRRVSARTTQAIDLIFPFNPTP